MGLLSKLHLKSKKDKLKEKVKPHKDKDQPDKPKHGHQHSQEAVRPQHDKSKRQKAQLILGDVPHKPAWFAGKGLQGDTAYDIERQPSKQRPHSKPADRPKPTGMCIASRRLLIILPGWAHCFHWRFITGSNADLTV